MLKLIKSDLYKFFNRKYTYIYLGITALLCLTLNILFRFSNIPTTLHGIMTLCLQSLLVPIFLIIVPIDITTCDEIKQGTLKNSVSFGISKTKLFISKVIASSILCVITALVILVFFLGTAALLFPHGAGLTTAFLGTFWEKVLLALPLYAGVVVLGTALCFLIRNNTAFTFIYIGLFSLTAGIIKLLAMLVSKDFLKLENLLITTNINILTGNSTSNQMLSASAVGLGYIIVFLIAGILIFRKQEVK